MNTKRLLATLFLFSTFLYFGPKLVKAQEPIQPEPPIIEPPQWRMDDLKIDYQRVDVTIEDQVATTHIDQLFVNENDWMLEGTYLFPLPQGAVVSQLTMWVDGQPIEAKILPKEEARQIYDDIVRQLRDPALLEYVGSSAIQANVFPIPPHNERRIEIVYSQVLNAENGLVHYIYPQSTDLYSNIPLNKQNIRVEVLSKERIHAIYSPSHAVAVSRDGDYEAVVGYEAENVEPENDFELYYTISADEIGLNLLSYRQDGEDGFFMLLVAPEIKVEEVVAKDVILVLDTSGSMEGQKLEQAKQAAAYIVDHLNQEDRFNIIAFSTGVRRFRPDLAAVDEAGAYDSFINSLEAVGGTNISEALLEAASQADQERPTTIIFITDGLATEGITEMGLLLNAVGTATPQNARIFSFGVGNDVDPDLLDNLSQDHRGTTTYVLPGQTIDEEVSGFYAKVSSPVLSNIKLDYDGVIVEQTYPQTLPDLFAGTQLVISGRYRDGGPAQITLSGDVNGRPQEFKYADNYFQINGGADFIPRLWATRAIGHLLREIRLNGEKDELVQSVVNLSIRYGIITPFTSYLIEEEDIFSQTGRNIIIEEELQMADKALEASQAPVTVEEAAVQAEMAAAEAPMTLSLATTPANQDNAFGSVVQELVRVVGSKTFILRDNIWMDTAFDKDVHEVQEIGFASDAYFDLLSTAPSLGRYLALGQEVLVVLEGQAYQIVPSAETINDPGQATFEPEPAPIVPIEMTESVEETEANTTIFSQPTAAPGPGSTVCSSLFAFPGLLGLAVIGAWYVRKRR